MQQICDFHLRFIRFICVDNQCQNKLLCDDCQKSTNEHANHKVIDSATFFQVAEQFLKGSQPDFVLYGSDLQQKQKIFLKSTSNIRQEIKVNHLKKLEDQIDKYYQTMVEGLLHSKKSMTEFIQSQIDECFSSQILNNRESGYVIVQQVINALNARISTKEANNLLHKLHTGELEKEYYENKIEALIELFSIHVKEILDPLSSQVGRYLRNFQSEIEKIKISLKEENFQIIKSNMIPKQFKIKEIQINQNLQLKMKNVNYVRQVKQVTMSSEPTEFDLSARPLKMSRIRKQELLKSLDYTNQTLSKSSSHHVITKTQPQAAPYDPTGNEFKRILLAHSQHQYLLKIINIHLNVCLSIGKDGVINLFTLDIGNGEISIKNHTTIRPHQEMQDVELCQTPGMFLTSGRNVKMLNEKYIDLGYTVKLFLYQDINQIEQLSEFRDLHQTPIELLKFINESYLRQRIEYSKYSNELEFATVSEGIVKFWKFSFDSTNIYEGEMVEVLKIDLKGTQIKSIDFQDSFTIISDKSNTYLYQKNELYKQLKIVNSLKDQVLKSKLISDHRFMILQSSCIITVVDLVLMQQPLPLSNLKDQPKPYEPLKINIKKFLRGILFENEEKEIELIDAIQARDKFIIFLHSSQYDHYLILNRKFELEHKVRLPPSEIRYLKLLEMDSTELMIAIEGKNEFSIWDMKK